MLCQSLSNYQSIEFITKILSRKRQQQKCFPKTEWRNVKTEKKKYCTSLPLPWWMWRLCLSCPLCYEKRQNTTQLLLSHLLLVRATTRPKAKIYFFERSSWWWEGALLSFFEMILLLKMNLTHMVVVVILVLRDAALETIALCTFCTYETFARNRVKIVGYEQSGHF